MKKQSTNAKSQLLELEKLVGKVIRKSLKDNTLDYTCQVAVSSFEPGEVKYAAQISSPANGVQPITFRFDTFQELKDSLVEAEKELDKEKVEMTFHQARINSYKVKIEAHEARMKQIEEGEEPEEEIAMEEV